MTLDETRTHITALLKARQEVSIPDNDVVIPLIHEHLENIANRYKVLALITKSENFRVLRSLGDGYYIRMPKAPRSSTDQLDIDRELHKAVANFVAADLASSQINRGIFNKRARKMVKDYAFKIKNTPPPVEAAS